MRPLISADLTSTLLSKKPILLVNTSILPLRSFTRYILANAFHGAAGRIPTETWLKIIGYAKIQNARYEVIQPIDMTSSEKTGTTLHRRALRLDVDTWKNKYEVINTNQCLASPPTYDQTPGGVEYEFNPLKIDTVYAIPYPRPAPMITGSNTPVSIILALTLLTCLFTSITVPDLIACLEEGDCWICERKRSICPGCTGGVAQEFEAFMSCGVDLTCPLCMGLELMEDHQRFLQEHYWEGPPLDLKAEWDEELEERKAELGFYLEG
ncbi:MAG: hypothetical protein L6R41_002461 [Letrouitia leprolyta]|nr:MAG: hypothetical protein L6R41_002461 [Letrouitia leprolyta]